MSREPIRTVMTKDHKAVTVTQTSKGLEIAADGRWVLLSAEVANEIGCVLVKATEAPHAR